MMNGIIYFNPASTSGPMAISIIKCPVEDWGLDLLDGGSLF